MATKFSLTTATLAMVATVGLSPMASAQNVQDVLVRDGAGNIIANDVRSFDENEAGSGLAVGFTAEVGSSFTFLYQANVVSFNDASGQTITPLTGLNKSFASGGYEFTVVASITETVTSVTTVGGITTVTFETTGGNASIFYDSATGGGVKSVTSTGAGFDDGTLVGQFDVVAGAGISNFTTFASGAGLGATQYDFVISAGRRQCRLHLRTDGTDRRSALHVEPGAPGRHVVDDGLPPGYADQCPGHLRNDRGRQQSAAEGRRLQYVHHRDPGARDLRADARRPGCDRLHDASAQEVLEGAKTNEPSVAGL